jgi:hypothetical protein
MQDFIDTLVRERDAGIAARNTREAGEGLASGPSDIVDDEPIEVVEAAWATTVRAVSNNEAVDPDDLPLIEAAKRHLGMTDDVTRLARFIGLMGVGKPQAQQMTLMDEPPVEDAAPVAPKTEQQQIDEIASRAHKSLTAAAALMATPKTPEYQEAMRGLNKRVAKRSGGIWAKDVRTLEQARTRYEAAKAVAAEVTDAYS